MLPTGDVPALVVLLGEPNRYLRAGALSHLVRHAPRLSQQQLRVVVELLGDGARVTSGSCLGYDSIRRTVMGQGQMLHAAQCSRYHTDTVRERAFTVLQAADTALLAPELVRSLSTRRTSRQYLVSIVQSRRAHFALPLQQQLLAGVRERQREQIASALELLEDVELGSAETKAVGALKQLVTSNEEVLALRAASVLASLLHESTLGSHFQEEQESAYALLRRALATAPERECPPDRECASLGLALELVRRMREAGAILLPELMSLLDSEVEFVRVQAMTALGALRGKAKPAVPRLVELLDRRPSAPPEDTFEIGAALEALAAIGARSAPARRAIVLAVRNNGYHLERGAAALAATKLPLPATEKSVLRRAYLEACSDAGSVAYFSFSRDERCDNSVEHLKSLGVRTDG